MSDLDDPELDRALGAVPPPPPLSEAARREVAGAAAVAPLASPETRALRAALLALAAVAAGGVLLRMGPRPHAPWWELVLLVAVSLAGIWLALRSAVPGRVPPARLWLPVLAAPAAFAAVAAALSGLGGELGPVACLEAGVALAVIPALVVAFFVARAFPVRPLLSGALAGTSAGLLGVALLQIHCPMTTGPHLVVMHDGVALIAAALGAATSLRSTR